jgi:hypothetical protein
LLLQEQKAKARGLLLLQEQKAKVQISF